MATYNSNHTLCNLGPWSAEVDGTEDLCQNLILNGKSNKKDVAQQKIICTHSVDNTKLHHFYHRPRVSVTATSDSFEPPASCRYLLTFNFYVYNTDLSLPPRVISWVGEEYGSLDVNNEIDSEGELNRFCLHYRLVRSLPVLFGLRSSVAGNNQKRPSLLLE